jgi:hypothetical protein
MNNFYTCREMVMYSLVVVVDIEHLVVEVNINLGSNTPEKLLYLLSFKLTLIHSKQLGHQSE